MVSSMANLRPSSKRNIDHSTSLLSYQDVKIEKIKVKP